MIVDMANELMKETIIITMVRKLAVNRMKMSPINQKFKKGQMSRKTIRIR